MYHIPISNQSIISICTFCLTIKLIFVLLFHFFPILITLLFVGSFHCLDSIMIGLSISRISLFVATVHVYILELYWGTYYTIFLIVFYLFYDLYAKYKYFDETRISWKIMTILTMELVSICLQSSHINMRISVTEEEDDCSTCSTWSMMKESEDLDDSVCYWLFLFIKVKIQFPKTLLKQFFQLAFYFFEFMPD